MQNLEKQYSHKDFTNLPQKIGEMFDKFNTARQSQLNDIKALQEQIYNLNNSLHPHAANGLELPNVYEQHQTLKAHIIDSIYTNPESLFDVSTAPGADATIAVKQKAMLTNALEKMKIGEKIDKIVNDLIETGECTLFVGWETRYKQMRRRADFAAGVFTNKEQGEIPKTDEAKTALLAPDAQNKRAAYFECTEKKVFDGVNVKTVAAQDFVFDYTRVNNWDYCPKIFRTYLTLDEIKADKNNVFITKEMEEALLEGTLASKDSETLKGYRKGQIEILEYWGDIELNDGTVLKNWFAVCAARQAIVRFEPNPFVTSPFIYANLIENPQTRRGISPLKCILPLNLVATKILNNQLDAYALIVNPPYLAPKGAFRGEQNVAPGKIIEYDSSLLPQTPVPLNFQSALCGWDFLRYFKDSIEGTTGIYRTMAGALAAEKRTATELNYATGGQNARLNLFIDHINRKVILPMVEKVAETIANFKVGKELVEGKIGDKTVVFEIGDIERGGDYIYRYSDRKASLQRRARNKELNETIANFAGIGEFSKKINWEECFRLALEQLGVENVDKFLKEEEEAK
jgi:polyhydroxyalkanoate synthesis regulator phasin